MRALLRSPGPRQFIPLTPGDSRSVHKYRVELAGASATTEPISSRNREHFLRGPYSPLRIRRMRCWPLGRKQGQAAHMQPVLILVLRVQHGTYFTCHYQGVSHAEWPKNSHHYAPTQIGGRHLLPPQGGGPRAQLAPSRRALKTRKEAMRGISHWPELKPSPAI
jgi:hypothetical protein